MLTKIKTNSKNEFTLLLSVVLFSFLLVYNRSLIVEFNGADDFMLLFSKPPRLKKHTNKNSKENPPRLQYKSTQGFNKISPWVLFEALICFKCLFAEAFYFF